MFTQEKYKEGIFEVIKDFKGDYLIRETILTKGTVEEIFLTDNDPILELLAEDRTIINLSTENRKGVVRIPFKFNNPNLLQKTQIKYSKEKYYGDENDMDTFKFEILDGPFKGKVFEKQNVY